MSMSIAIGACLVAFAIGYGAGSAVRIVRKAFEVID